MDITVHVRVAQLACPLQNIVLSCWVVKGDYQKSVLFWHFFPTLKDFDKVTWIFMMSFTMVETEAMSLADPSDTEVPAYSGRLCITRLALCLSLSIWSSSTFDRS